MLDSVRSPHTRRAYARALTRFLAWGRAGQAAGGFTKATVQAYRATLEAEGLSASAINVQLAAIRKVAAEAADNGWLAPDLAAGIAKVPEARGERTPGGELALPGTSRPAARGADPDRLKGKRDRAVLALLVACGLRRDELVRLQVADVQLREAVGCWSICSGRKDAGGRFRYLAGSRRRSTIGRQWLGSQTAACSGRSTRADASTATG